MLVFEKLLQMYVLFSYRVASLGPQSITVKPEKIICPRISEPCSLEILEMRNRDLKLQTTIECKILSVSMVRHKSGFFCILAWKMWRTSRTRAAVLNAPLGSGLAPGTVDHWWSCSELFHSALEAWHVCWLLDEKLVCYPLNRLHSRAWLCEWTVNESKKSLLW